MNFAEHIKINHFMTLEGLARKINVSHGVLRGIAAGTHKSQAVVDKLIEGGYINSANELPPFKSPEKSIRKVTSKGITFNSNCFVSAELFQLLNIGDIVLVREKEGDPKALEVFKDNAYICDAEISVAEIFMKSKAERNARKNGLIHVKETEFDFSYNHMAKRG